MGQKTVGYNLRHYNLAKAVSGCTQTYNPKQHNDYSISIGDGKAVQAVDEEKMRAYTFDDMGNANRFVDLFGDNVRYCYTEKKWYYYNSMKWCVDNIGVVLRMADKSVEAMKAEARLYLQADEENGGDMSKAFEKHMKASRSNKSKKQCSTRLNTISPYFRHKWINTVWH